MKPVGLALKNVTENIFTNKVSGEIMIIHVCLSCSRTSSNRIAGDDDCIQIVSLLYENDAIDGYLLDQLQSLKIQLLNNEDKSIVMRSLYGSE